MPRRLVEKSYRGNAVANVALMLLAVLCGQRSTCGAEPQRPNFLVIVADDLGIGEPGCYGGELPTPHLDRLAASGVRMTAGYVTAPFCAASRAALLTGRYQTRFGFEFNPIGAFNSDPAVGLPTSEQTIADRLRTAGYSTALVGKWHLGGTARFHPQRRGFDEFFGFLHEGHYYVPSPFDGHVTWLRRRTLPDGGQGRWTSPDGRVIWSTHMKGFEPDYDADNPILRSSQPVEEHRNLTESFTEEAESFIKRNAAQPFFLCVAYSAVHSPMQAPIDELTAHADIADFHRRLFAAMLGQLDRGVGRLMTALEKHSIADRTVVVFLSDNGGPTRELTSSNRPFRGEKGQLLEAGIRVPMMVRWPGVTGEGQTENRPVTSLDFPASFAAAAGVADSANGDGVDLRPYLSGSQAGPIHEGLYWRVGESAAYRAGRWKIHTRKRSGDSPWELYDLAHDEGETKDLAARYPDVAGRLAAAWSKANQSMVPPLWPPGGRPMSRPTEKQKE